MTGAAVPRIALLYPGDRTARDLADPAASRFAPLFEALAAAGLPAEAAVYDDDFADEVRAQLHGVQAVLVWCNPIEQGRCRERLDAMLRDIAQPVRQVAHARARCAQGGRARQQAASHRVQFHLARGAIGQSEARRLLELVDPPGQCGLRQVRRFGAAANAAQFGDRDEGVQIGQIETHAESGSIAGIIATCFSSGARAEAWPSETSDAARNASPTPRITIVQLMLVLTALPVAAVPEH